MAINTEKMPVQSGNLSDLTKIPPHEFEMHFQNWMEQDDVARSLQAKLRKDLIMNFNKTSLGKKLMSQTVGGGAYGRGTGFQRLSLSPLILALNTLVAEFLYAQNCHFSLSVFCTEIPYRNTLPDFESMRNFRFCHSEIMDILEAVLPSAANKDKPIAIQIIKEYSKNSGMSLLLLILKSIISRMGASPNPATVSVPAHNSASSPSPSRNKQSEPKGKEHKGVQHESGTYNQDESFKHLNKYLLMLTKKVGAMIEIFDGTKKVAPSVSTASIRPRLLLSTRARKYDTLNRSLERVTENLKQLSRAKRKNRNISAIVEAINTLANQFSKCSARLEGGATEPKKPIRRTGRSSRLKKQIAAHPRERSYSEWVYDLRNTTNGQKFLDRIESSVRKTFNKQKEKLRYDMETKLRLHKELLKMHYKQKLTEELSKHESKILSHEDFDSSPSQTTDLNQKPSGVSLNYRDATPRKKTPPKMERIPEEDIEEYSEKEKRPTFAHAIVQTSTTTAPCTNTAVKPVMDTQKEIEQFAKSIIVQERKVDNIVNDAKLRVQQLEIESNQIDQNFYNFLERQRIEKELTRETANKLWKSYTMERDALCKKYGFAHENNQEKTTLVNNRELSPLRNNEECVQVEAKKQTQLKEAKTISIVGDNSDQLEYTNAILEAKDKFFADAAEDRRAKEKLHRPISSELVNGAKGDGSFNTIVGAYFINKNFGMLESEPNIAQTGNRFINNAQITSTQISSAGNSSPLSSPKPFGKRSLFKPTTPLKRFSTTDVPNPSTLSSQAKETTTRIETVETSASAILAKAEAAAESAAKTLYKNRNYFEKKAERERSLRANAEQQENGTLMNDHQKHVENKKNLPPCSAVNSDECGTKKSTTSFSDMQNTKQNGSPRASLVEDSLAKMRRLFQNSGEDEKEIRNTIKQQLQPDTVDKGTPRALDRFFSNQMSQSNENNSNLQAKNIEHQVTRYMHSSRTSNDDMMTIGSRLSDPIVFRSTAGEDILDRDNGSTSSIVKEQNGKTRYVVKPVFNQTYSVDSNFEGSSFADVSDGSKEETLANVNDLLVRYSILRSSLVRPSRSDAATSVNDPTEESQGDYTACGGRSLPFPKTFVVRPIGAECKSAPLMSQSVNSQPKVRVKLERVCQPINEGRDNDRNNGIFHTIACSKSSSSTSSESNDDVPILTGSRSESDSDFWD